MLATAEEFEDYEEPEEAVILDAMAPSHRLSVLDPCCRVEISGPLTFAANDVNSNQVLLTECFSSETASSEPVTKFRVADDSTSGSSLRRFMFEIRVDRITENILTMVFPTSGDEEDYAWSLHDVSKKLRIKYGSRYKILNLSERREDLTELNDSVIDYGWPEDLAPPIRFLRAMCHEIRSWLATNRQNVIVLHCKGGTGRLATLIAAYMYFCDTRGRIDQSVLSDKGALKQYYEDKLNTYCLPSQRRYVQYFSELLSGSLSLVDATVHLHSVTLSGLPRLEPSSTGCFHLKIYQNMRLLRVSNILQVSQAIERLIFELSPPAALNGDVLIKCFYQKDSFSQREAVFWLQFHTCAVRGEQLNLYKQELDAACLDFRYPANARVELYFKHSPALHEDFAKSLSVGGGVISRNDQDVPSFVHCDSYEDLCLDSVVTSPKHWFSDIDSASQIHGPMDQQQTTRLSAVTHTGGPIEGKLEAHVAKMSEETEERRTRLSADRMPSSTAATLMAASSDANELDRLLEELKVVGGESHTSQQHHHHHASTSSSAGAGHNVTSNRTVHVTASSQPQASYSTTITRTHNAKLDQEQVLIDELRSAQDRLLSLRRAQSTEGAGGGSFREAESGPGFRYEREVQRGPGWENVAVHRESQSRQGHSSGEQEAFDISLRYSSLPAARKGHRETSASHWESVEREALMPAQTVRHRSSSSDRFAPQQSAQTTHWSHESRSYSSSGMRGPAGRSVSVEAPRFPTDEADLHHQQHHHQQHQHHHQHHQGFRSNSQEHFIEPHHRYDVETVEVHRDEPLTNTYSAHRENQRFQQQMLQQQQQQQQQQREYQQSMQRSYQQSRSVQETAPEVVEEVETVTLQPIGKGVQDLEANRPNTPGVPNAMNSRTPTMMRAADAHAQQQQQQQQQTTTTKTYQHSVQVHQSGHDPYMSSRSPGPVRHHISSSSSAPFEQDIFSQQQHMFAQSARTDSFSSMDGAFEMSSSSQAAPKFVKDTSCFWYKPKISREEAISLLRDKAPGLFVVRDSNSYPGAFGLAVKVAQLPPGVTPKSDVNSPHFQDDLQSELVRHFLIEPTSKGVRLKGCANEPVFGSLAALVYQHTLTPLALPCRLVVPEQDLAANVGGASDIARQGAACNLLYLGSVDVEAMTGNNAVSRAVDIVIAQMNAGRPTTDVHFKASSEGITLTDALRRLFFRRHYPLNLISFCGLDPKDRVWDSPELRSRNIQESRIFAVVTRRQGSPSENVCHVFSELDAAQPATAVVRFVTKHLLGGSAH